MSRAYLVQDGPLTLGFVSLGDGSPEAPRVDRWYFCDRDRGYAPSSIHGYPTQREATAMLRDFRRMKQESQASRVDRARAVVEQYRGARRRLSGEETGEAIGDLLMDLMDLADSISPGTWRDAYLQAEHHHDKENV